MAQSPCSSIIYLQLLLLQDKLFRTKVTCSVLLAVIKFYEDLSLAALYVILSPFMVVKFCIVL